MHQAIDQLLEQRLARRNNRRRSLCVALSVTGHLALTGGIALAPALAARQRPPMEFIQVQIVPLQALGVPDPVQPRARPEPPPQQTSRPVPAVAEEDEQIRAPRPEVKETAPVPRNRETGAEESTSGTAAGPMQRRGSPTGSPLATSPFGTAVAGFDNPDFVYGYYVEQMLAMIGSNWVRPSVGDDLEMTIHFRIDGDGALSEIEVVAPSGHPSFDLAGERAVRLASPLPPLPKSFPHDSLGVNLIIR